MSSPSDSNSNNFGLGLLGVSQNNVVENNRMVGNVNGFYLGGGGQVTGNIIRRNMIIGNPPAQVSNTFGSAIGADIQDFSPIGANTFHRNYSLTYAGAGPSPCPNISEPGNADSLGDSSEAFRAISQIALKQTDIGSLFSDLWARLRPIAPQRNVPGRSTGTGDSLFDRFPGR